MKTLKKFLLLSSLILTYSCSFQDKISSESFSFTTNSETNSSNSLTNNSSSESNNSISSNKESITSNENVKSEESSSSNQTSSTQEVNSEESSSSNQISSTQEVSSETKISSSNLTNESLSTNSSESVSSSLEDIGFDLDSFIMPSIYVGSYFGKLEDANYNLYAFNNISELNIIIESSNNIVINNLSATIINYNEINGFTLLINEKIYYLEGKEENETIASLNFYDNDSEFTTKFIYRSDLNYNIPSNLVGTYKGALNYGEQEYKFNNSNLLTIVITSNKITINNLTIKVIKYDETSFSFINNDVLYSISTYSVDETVNEINFEDENRELSSTLYRIGRSVNIPSTYIGTYKGVLDDEEQQINGSNSITIIMTTNSLRINNLVADLISYSDDVLEFLVNGDLFTLYFYYYEDENNVELDFSDSFNLYSCALLTK